MSAIARALFALSLTLLSVSAVGAETEITYKVGSELDFFPYAFKNPDGEADGFSVDLIKSVAKTMNLKIQITAEPWDKVWNDLVERRIDILPLVGKLSERATVIEFSMPHTSTSDAFFYAKGKPIFPNIPAATGKSIVVMKSDVAHHKLLEMKFEGEIVPVTTITEGIQLVALGKHDAFLGPLLMGTLAVKENKIQNVFIGEPVIDYIRIQAFAVKKGDFELLSKLNQGLEIIKANGEYNRIYSKWLSLEDSQDNSLNYSVAGMLFIGVLAMIVLIVIVRRSVRRTEV